jgi:hypothetical protein
MCRSSTARSRKGIFPDAKDLKPVTAAQQYEMEEVDNMLKRSALNFRPQKEVLNAIPKRRAEKSLQIYFW